MLTKTKIRFLSSLKERKFRYEHGLFMAEGEKILEEVFQEGIIPVEIYATEEVERKREFSAPKNSTPFLRVTAREFKQISSLQSPSGCACLLKIPVPPAEDELLSVVKGYKNLLPVILQINDPGNLGTFMRIADWYGLKYVLCGENSVDPCNPKVIQASMGSFLRVSVYPVSNIPALISAAGKTVYVADLKGKDFRTVNFERNSLLIFGQESKGINTWKNKFSGLSITIPRTGKAESLNVAVSFGIIVDRALNQ